MLLLKDIKKVINKKLIDGFPEIEVQSSDVKEGFKRPAFYVNLETNRLDKSQFTLLRDMTCRVYFFPTSRYEYEEEIYEVQDKLEELFGLNFEILFSNILTLKLDSVQIGQTVTINGITFTAHAETAPAKREFSVVGDDKADAVELAGLINNSTYGTPGVAATVKDNIITLASSDLIAVTAPGTITVKTVDLQSRVITITDADTFIVDEVLHYSFNFVYYENVAEEETGELMEDLEYHG